MSELTCDHKYQFLRQEITPTKKWEHRVNERKVEDVFFCERCLSYQKVLVRREEPDRGSFGWREVV